MSLKTPANTFLYLSGLLEIVYEPTTAFRCAQLKQDTERCGNKITKHSLELLKESFRHLFAILNDPDCKFHEQDGVFDTVLTQLIATCLCRNRHQKNAEDARKQWLEELYHDEKRYQLRCKLQTCLLEPLGEPINAAPSLPTEFELCDSKPSSPKQQVSLKVTNKLLEPLTETDQQSGFLYLISHPRESSMFKVGHTKNTEKRFGNHKRCYEDFKAIKKEFIPYVRRIEQLIITEFSAKQYKLKEKCQRCDKCHKEWIKASEAKLIKSFNKWVKFAKSDKRPYDKNGFFKSGVALPSPAMDFKPPASTPTKGSRRSNGPSQESPCKPDDESDVSIVEGMSNLSFDGVSAYSDVDDLSIVSSLSVRLAAARIG